MVHDRFGSTPGWGWLSSLRQKTPAVRGVMGAVLVISAVMLRSDIFSRSTAYMGILAAVLLLVGDLSAGHTSLEHYCHSIWYWVRALDNVVIPGRPKTFQNKKCVLKR